MFTVINSFCGIPVSTELPFEAVPKEFVGQLISQGFIQISSGATINDLNYSGPKIMNEVDYQILNRDTVVVVRNDDDGTKSVAIPAIDDEGHSVDFIIVNQNLTGCQVHLFDFSDVSAGTYVTNKLGQNVTIPVTLAQGGVLRVVGKRTGNYTDFVFIQ